MKKVYISGPYRAPTEQEVYQNIQRAREASIGWWKAGASVFCPHMNSAFLGGIVPDGRFLRADLEFLRVCHIIDMIAEWEKSEGAMMEYYEAIESIEGIKVLEIHYKKADGSEIYRRLGPNFERRDDSKTREEWLLEP